MHKLPVRPVERAAHWCHTAEILTTAPFWGYVHSTSNQHQCIVWPPCTTKAAWIVQVCNAWFLQAMGSPSRLAIYRVCQSLEPWCWHYGKLPTTSASSVRALDTAAL